MTVEIEYLTADNLKQNTQKKTKKNKRTAVQLTVKE